MAQSPNFWNFSSQVNTTDSGSSFNDQFRSRIVRVGDGYAVIWHDNANSGEAEEVFTQVKAQLFDFLGNRIGGEIVVGGNISLMADVPLLGDNSPVDSISAVSLPGGGFAVVYQVGKPGQITTVPDFEIVWFNAQGQETLRTGLNPVAGAGTVRHPELTVNAAGNLLLAFQKSAEGATDSSVMAMEIQPNGAAGRQFTIVNAESSAVALGNALLDNGNTVVLWRKESPFFTLGDEYVYLGFRLTGNNGAPLAASKTISFDEEEPANIGEADVTALPGGGFAVAWEQLHPVTGWDIGIAVYASNGILIRKDIIATPGAALGKQVLHDIVALKDGGFMMAWRDETSGMSFAQNFTATGVADGPAAEIANNVFNAEMTLLADGRVAISFDRATSGDPLFANNMNVRTYIIDPRDPDISGSNGNDRITSRSDGAHVSGLGGNDTIFGRNGVDILDGGTGADVISGEGGNDFIDGGTGNDILSGGGGDDLINGKADDDFMTGGAGEDALLGEDGNDQLLGGEGDDIMVGGQGDDRYGVDSAGDSITEQADSGIDHVSSSVSHVLGTNVENLDLIGTAAINGAGNSLANIMNGNSNANTISGGGGIDTIDAKSGNDTVSGGAGGDTLQGGLGFDALDYALSGSGVTVNILNNTATGGDAAGDVISGFEAIYGSGLSDVLVGNAASNRLRGNAGQDTLTGNGGADVFDYDTITDSPVANGESDIITDFDSNDRIDLRSIDADPNLAGDQAFSFIGSAAFSAPGQVRVNLGTANTVISVNLTGNAGSEMRIVLQGLQTVDATDLLL